MSGGSFNYLCHKSVEDLLAGGHDDDLENMEDELRAFGHPHAHRAADATKVLREEIKRTRRELEDRLEGLEKVFHAVEWWRSCDWGPDQVHRVLDSWSHKRGLS